jgi:hypothetical protein
MKKNVPVLLTLILILTLLLSACELPLPISAAGDSKEGEVTETDPAPTEEETEVPTSEETETPVATEEPAETEAVEETAEVEPTQEPTQNPSGQTYGPTDFPEGINPLTGLPMSDPDLLKLPPALISISNFPASARPQAGINSSPLIFEMTIGEGMTRFLAMFYGVFPKTVSGQTEGDPIGGTSGGAGDSSSGDSSGGSSGDDSSGDTAGDGVDASTASVGPIRSGRLPYEDIRSIYSGFLVMASAYSGVAQTLSDATTIYGSDSSDINSAMIGIDSLYNIALGHADGYPGSDFNLEGMKFSPDVPEDGKPADTVWVFYSNLNQIQWRYDEALGGYVRYDIKTDGSGEFVMATDRLTGDPVLRENVIVIYAFHEYYAPTLIDVYLTNMPRMKAVMFRDGQVFDIFWTTQYGDYEKETGLLRPMRFVDANGDPVALKNGRTWIEIVSTSSFHVESEISDYPFTPIKEAEGTGLWLVRYKGIY